jgi:hypothetical protein
MGELVVRTLSQGLQAFLPVAFGLVWARRAGHLQAVTAVRAGLYASIPITFAAGYLFQRTAYQARCEATLALLAVVIAVVYGSLVSATPDSASWPSSVVRRIDDSPGRGHRAADRATDDGD